MKEKIINEFEYWKRYDNNGNVIYHKNSNGYESWWDYDENNNLIHHKDSNGDEIICI